jgi:predicted MPP superfamily phosphohydrolase
VFARRGTNVNSMRIALLQLSDIHFGSASNPVADRAVRIKDAIHGKVLGADACFIAVSGDVANTGDPEEYSTARAFFSELRSALLLSGFPRVDFVAIPGNHDCNLRKQNETRTFLLDALDNYLAKPVDLNGSNFAALIKVQNDFFKFEAELCGHDVLAAEERLHYQRIFTVDGKTFVFHCFNTAWLSRKNEVAAKLFLPPEVLLDATAPDAVLSVALFHHPYNWLNPDNFRALKLYVEHQSDIVLTGHEHVGSQSRRILGSGEELQYFEAPALYDSESSSSGFQMALFDLDEKQQAIATFQWNGDRYAETGSRDWTIKRNPARPTDAFENTAEFFSELRSIGTGFRHPRRTPPHSTLSLRDLFVYPDLRQRDLDKLIAEDKKPGSIAGEQISEYILSNEKVVIYGGDDSGKSSLAKILYEDFQNKGFVPLLIRGEQLMGRQKESAIPDFLRHSAAVQYGANAAERFMQHDPAKCLLIVDDFHFARLTTTVQKKVMLRLRDKFRFIIIFASDLFRLQELARSADDSAFVDFSRAEIKEFGKFHRARLIEKWHYLGREDTAEPEEVAKLVLWTDKTIATLLGKNVLPHYPVIILTLLQLLEAGDTNNTANGSYGYLYEVLIKTALATSDRGTKDVDLKVTYMSGLAYFMFKRNQATLTESEFREAHQLYCSRYDMVRDFSQMESALLKSEMLVESHGSYRFKYPYIWYYSLAKYLQENAGTLRPDLNEIADHIYSDLNANTLIFYVYLTKDAELIRRLIDSAKQIYDEHDPCNLESHVGFINKMITQTPPPLQLGSTDLRFNRDSANRNQDAAAEIQKEREHSEGSAGDYKYNRKLDDIVKINIAFKTLQILGQVLRNFPGSLEGDLKLDITRESYLLGLRTVRALLSLAENNLDSMRVYIADLIAERTGIADQELANKTESAIIWLAGAAAFGTVKRVSYAVGHQDLAATYDRVLAMERSLSNRIIDVAIKLDHYDDIPEAELRKL